MDTSAGRPPRKPADPEATPSSAKTRPSKSTRSSKPRRISEKRHRANELLRVELHGLRTSLSQTLEALEVRVGGRINDMLRTLEGDDSLDQPPRFLTTAQAQAALDEIKAVRFRPDKPRIRELRKLQRLVKALRRKIPE